MRPVSLIPVFTILFCFFASALYSQDSTSKVLLKEIEIRGQQFKNELARLPETQGSYIFSGKKNEVVYVRSLDADLSSNQARQLFAKVPGISIWESDGSGIQTGVSSRGLSPNRSSEFNVRQNGYDICSEVFGYPEAYYSPPAEAIDKIELVRGAASLQFGPQFGGLLNYEIKKAPKDRPIAFESQQTLGSYGLFNSFNALGGTLKKWSYYGYYHHRSADGWRENSDYRTNTGYLSIHYAPNPKWTIGLDYTRMDYVSQQPGGLTDSLYRLDSRQSVRARNWFSAPWNVGSISFEYNRNEQSRFTLKLFGTHSQRNSVGFTKAITIPDTFHISLNAFNPRQVDRDQYQNAGAEWRFARDYRIGKHNHTLAAGLRAYSGSTERRQLGIGDTGESYELDIETQNNGKEWGRDLEFGTQNAAVFMENLFRFGSRFRLTPGLRYEYVKSTASGYINTTSQGSISEQSQSRNILLLGLGAEYHLAANTEWYANFSQAYRPVTYSELTPSAVSDQIDPDLEDAKGYNIDLGYRGHIGEYLNFDLGVFYLFYDGRIGSILKDSLVFRTNIGTSVSKGFEGFVEFHPVRLWMPDSRWGFINLFVNYSYIDASYTRWDDPAQLSNPSKTLVNKRVEYAPRFILRCGINYRIQKLSVSAQLNAVDGTFTDALNTETPNAAATIGKLDPYQVLDLNLSYSFKKHYQLKAGVNNLLDERYATRRAGGYPGPGLMPANGRTSFVSLGVCF